MQLEFGGQRYPVTAGESTIGTDPEGAVVLSGSGVRRRHAVLHGSPVGVAIRAASDATVLVNGAPVGGDPRPLRHGDQVTIGPNDLLVVDPDHQDAVPVDAAAVQPVLVAPSGATYRLADTMHGMPAAKWQPSGSPAESPRQTNGTLRALASFLVRTGEQKGRRLSVHRVSVSIGRAGTSDVVIDDASVSGEHARLRRRDGLWMLTDVGSTNGTYVDGERVTDDAPLLPGATVRFGDVTALFEPYDEPSAPADVRPAVSARPRRSPPVPEPEASPGVSKWLIMALLIAAIAGAAFGFVLLR
jgi:pSer/pThr/pTyr-binding forkhead associated (FHA) protein